MQKLIFTMAFVLLAFLAKAQWTTSGNSIYNSNTGNVGVGTTTPTEKLQVSNGNISAYNGNIILNNSAINQLESGTIRWNEYGNNNNFSGAYMKYNGSSNYLQLFTNNESTDTEHLRVYRNSHLILQPTSGNVGIGTTTPDAKLAVKGTIHAEEVKVDLQVPPDYVFEKYYTGASELKEDYQMPTLEEVAAYTEKNHHLPNVPSAATIQTEGLHLKEMTTLLLQKIEELTLYTIEQQKEIEALKEKLK